MTTKTLCPGSYRSRDWGHHLRSPSGGLFCLNFWFRRRFRSALRRAIAETPVAPDERRRTAHLQVDEISFEDFLADSGSGFERRKDCALGLRDTECGVHEWVGDKRTVDRRKQRVEAD